MAIHSPFLTSVDCASPTGDEGGAMSEGEADVAPPAVCKFDGCDRTDLGAHAGHGWCRLHYRRWATSGSPALIGPGKPRALALTAKGWRAVGRPDIADALDDIAPPVPVVADLVGLE